MFESYSVYIIGLICFWAGWRLGWWRGRKHLEGQFKKDLESKYGPLPNFKNSDGSSPFDPNYNPSNTNLNDFGTRILDSVGAHWKCPKKKGESSADYRKRLHEFIKESRK